MILLNTDKLPSDTKIDTLFNMIQFTGMVEVSSKSIIRNIFEEKKNEYQEALNNFQSLAPKEANAIINIQLSTTAQDFNNGTFLYLTYTGTPAIISDVE